MENVYYPHAIRETAPSSSESNNVPEEDEAVGLEVVVATIALDELAKESEPSEVVETSESLNLEAPQKVAESTAEAQAIHAEEPTLLVEPLQAVPLGEGCKDLETTLLNFLRRGLRPSQRNRPSRLAFALFLFLCCFIYLLLLSPFF